VAIAASGIRIYTQKSAKRRAEVTEWHTFARPDRGVGPASEPRSVCPDMHLHGILSVSVGLIHQTRRLKLPNEPTQIID